MTVYLLGAESSPGCASFALRKTAEDNRTAKEVIESDLDRDNVPTE